MKLLNIKISEAKQSPTNTPGRNEGKSFDDLVASIKEKGVLMPVLAREITRKSTKDYQYEVIAGNRRLAAAKEAGLEEIPAQIVEMNDVDAREAQIVENLQREDIHSLDEGESYRTLIEASSPRYEVKDVALKVGKSESYVRTRLALTNLTEKSAKAFRKNEITIREAILLARVDDQKTQNQALEKFKDYSWEFDSVSEWIRTATYLKAMKNPNPLMLTAEEKPNLFGDKTLGIDPVTYGQRIAALIEKKMEDAKEKGNIMVRISTKYGSPDSKEVLGRDQYKTLNSKEDKAAAKNHSYGIVAEGDDLGQVYLITMHPDDLKQNAGGSVYKLSKAEKEKRQKENEKIKKEKEKEIESINAALKKVKWPMSEKHLNVLVDLVFRRLGFSYVQPVATRHEIKALKVKKNGYVQRDLDTPVKEYVDALDNAGKLRFAFEVILETVNRDKEVLKKF